MQNITQFSGFYDEEPQRCLNEDFEIDSYSKGNTICYGISNYSANSTNQQNI